MSTQGEGGLGCVIQCLTVKVCRQSFLAHQDLEESMSTIQIASLERTDRLKFNVFAASVAVTALFSLVSPAQAQTQPQRPNIVVIWGDDIGFWNISAYSRGMMGYQTPNIDRIANEGALFTDVYAQQSCTAGRAAFI